MADARTSPGSRVVPRVSPDAQRALDVTLGLAGMTVGAAVVAVRTAHRVTAPVTRLLWRPPLLPRSLHPATILEEAARTGRAEQVALRRRFEVLLDAWAPVLVEAVVERIDLTRLVREHVDLDALVASVDLDAAVARVDLDAAVARVDLDAIAATLDVDAVVARADLDRVIARIDIVRIVEEVLDAIDLPAIIRDSTGSMASETVRGVRMTGVSADDALSRVVDRALFRRRHPERPGGPA